MAGGPAQEKTLMPHQESRNYRPDSLIDLSHTVVAGMTTYKGLPGPIICDFLAREASRKLYAPGVEFQIGRIDMVANTGTYVDSPFHRYADGPDLSELPISSLANLPTLIIHTADATAIDVDTFRGHDVGGKAVLIHTDWSRHWGSEHYFQNHPFLTAEAALHLRDAGARIVGIDSHNIDDVSDLRRPVHSTLLRAGIPIVEHMTNLQAAPEEGARFFAVPVKVKGFGTFPVRAFVLTA